MQSFIKRDDAPGCLAIYLCFLFLLAPFGPPLLDYVHRPELNVSYPGRKGWRGVFIIRVLKTQTRVRVSARVTKGLSPLGS